MRFQEHMKIKHYHPFENDDLKLDEDEFKELVRKNLKKKT